MRQTIDFDAMPLCALIIGSRRALRINESNRTKRAHSATCWMETPPINKCRHQHVINQKLCANLHYSVSQSQGNPIVYLVRLRFSSHLHPLLSQWSFPWLSLEMRRLRSEGSPSDLLVAARKRARASELHDLKTWMSHSKTTTRVRGPLPIVFTSIELPRSLINYIHRSFDVPSEFSECGYLPSDSRPTITNSQAGSNACAAFLFCWHWQLFWSTWGTVLISYSRYWTIKDPLADGVTTRKAAFASAATCLMGIVIAVPPLFTWARYEMGSFVDPNGYSAQWTRLIALTISRFALFYYPIGCLL